MMRLRRATAITALFVLAGVATASAECAWVLWETSPGTKHEWKAITAATSHDKCEEKAVQSTRLNLEQIQAGRMSSTLVYECFPDTVDPRGPKAK